MIPNLGFLDCLHRPQLDCNLCPTRCLLVECIAVIVGLTPCCRNRSLIQFGNTYTTNSYVIIFYILNILLFKQTIIHGSVVEIRRSVLSPSI